MVMQIAGIVTQGGCPPDRAWVEAMLDRLNPNGLPARREVAGFGPAVFGVIATCPQGVEPGPAPRVVEQDGTLFVADAKLYVRDNLPEGPDDTCRMAAAVCTSGPKAAAGFEGDFAFAWWNGRTLVLARDHFGVRPLLRVHREGEYSAFASHPAALLQTGLASRALNDCAVINFCHLDAPPLGQSFYRDIASVEPGRLHSLSVGRPPAIERFWQLPISPRVSWNSDPDELAAEVRRLMLQAVQRRLPPDGPVAAHLSGGIDSTPLVAAAARMIAPQGRTVHAFAQMETDESFGFPLIDEAEYVRAAADAEPNVQLEPVAPFDIFRETSEGYDLDTFLPVSPRHPERWTLRRAAALGAPVVFSGWGGDQLSSFGGLGAAFELLRSGRLLRLARHFRHRKPGSTLKGAIYRQIVTAPLSPSLRRRLDRLVLGLEPEEPYAFRFVPDSRRDEILEVAQPNNTDSRIVRRSKIEYLYPGYRFQTFAHMAAEQGIAHVYPLMDLDLARFVSTIPGCFFVRDGVARSLHRDAIQGLVPELVRQRQAKFMPHPLDAIRMARRAPEMLRRLQTLGSDGTAARFIALDRLTEDVAALDADGVTAAVRAEAMRGEQHYLPFFAAIPATQMAVVLDQYDREFGDGAAEPAARSCAAAG